MEHCSGREGWVTLMVHWTGKILSTNSVTISYFANLVGQRERPTVRQLCIRAAYDFSHLTLAWTYPDGPSGVTQNDPYRRAAWRPVELHRFPVTFPASLPYLCCSLMALVPLFQRRHELQLLSSLKNVSSPLVCLSSAEMCGEDK
jgi:hypothetical protein